MNAMILRWQALTALRSAHPFSAAVVVFCVLLIVGVGALIVYPQVAGASHWRQAQTALEQQDFASARSHLERCREVWPKSSATAFLLARTCRRAGNFAEARKQLQVAESLGWTAALIELERLLLQAQAGLVQPVQQELNRYLEVWPSERPVIFEALVIGALQGNFVDDAYRWSTRWTEAYPDAWPAHVLRGRVLERGLRYDLAADEYRQALECKSDLLAAHLGLGEMLLRKGHYVEALPHFQSCLDRSPHDVAALYGLARCQRYLSPPEVSLATLDRLFADDPQHAGGLLLRGQLELERGRAEEAVLWLERAERVQPPELDTYQALVTAFRLLNRKDEAEAYEAKRQQTERDLRRMETLTKEIIERPQDVPLRCEAGTTLLRLGQEQQGIRWLVSALLIDPQHQPAKKALAACLAKLGDPALLEQYRRLLDER
jgi:tetratricopeptide (TPR) repeat protein